MVWNSQKSALAISSLDVVIHDIANSIGSWLFERERELEERACLYTQIYARYVILIGIFWEFHIQKKLFFDLHFAITLLHIAHKYQFDITCYIRYISIMSYTCHIRYISDFWEFHTPPYTYTIAHFEYTFPP